MSTSSLEPVSGSSMSAARIGSEMAGVSWNGFYERSRFVRRWRCYGYTYTHKLANSCTRSILIQQYTHLPPHSSTNTNTKPKLTRPLYQILFSLFPPLPPVFILRLLPVATPSPPSIVSLGLLKNRLGPWPSFSWYARYPLCAGSR